MKKFFILIILILFPVFVYSQERFRSGIFLHHSTGSNIWGPNLSNTSVNMFERIDFVFVNSTPIGPDPEWGPVVVIGDEYAERSNNLWASDHAGVITMMKFIKIYRCVILVVGRNQTVDK